MVDNLIGQEEEVLDEPMFSAEELDSELESSISESANKTADSDDVVLETDSDVEDVSESDQSLNSDASQDQSLDAVNENSEFDGSASVDTEDESVELEEEKEEGSWYTIQCFSLQEHKVSRRIHQMMEGELKDKVFALLLPEEETVEIKNNKRQERLTKIYPGYVFVRTLPDEEVWFKLRQIPGVATIIGSKVPTPISENEMDKILRQMGDKTKKIEIDFEIDEVIRVVSGPFRGYSGIISEINSERGKLKALISIFGRETPVELDFDQVEQTVGS